MKTITTAKKGNQAVIIEGHTIVKHSDGLFTIHNDGGANGSPSEFDPAPFIEYFYFWKQAAIHKAETERLHEAARIENLKERIRALENPVELINEFKNELTGVEIADHWSALPKGMGHRGILIHGRKGFEIMELAVDIHGIEGTFGEACNRDGEHHHTFKSIYGGLKEYQESLNRHFAGNHFYYKSPESETETAIEEIKDLIEDEPIDLDLVEAIETVIKNLKEIEPGFYSCASGCIGQSDAKLNNPDLSGYHYDVYSYSFAFCFDGYEFKKEDDTD